ncbi:guanine nucleotide exchange protein for ADP-robosylation factor [Entophlyctis luteolus]|nr:guanine nucleotide exchange protein for ADP-robosylation factor [Entophlyctis luteolus]
MHNPSAADTFIKRTLDQLITSKEGKKIPALLSSVKQASGFLDRKDLDFTEVQTIFLPFQVACQSNQSLLATTAIDCLGKLFTYNYWGRIKEKKTEESTITKVAIKVADSKNPPKKSESEFSDRFDGFDADGYDNGSEDGIVGLVVRTICETFIGESTDDKLQLQIIKALLSSISTADSRCAVHGASLMRAIRTTFNIFLLAKSPTTQMMAQTTLQQMVQSIFGKVSPSNQPQGSFDSESLEINVTSTSARTSVSPERDNQKVLGRSPDSFRDPKSSGGKILVEIYLNYDCDIEATAQENIWERLINTLSMSIQENNNAPSTGILTSGTSQQHSIGNSDIPNLTTANLPVYTKEQIREFNATTGDHNEIKKHSLQLLVRGILKPLTDWISFKVESESKQSDSQALSSTNDSDATIPIKKESERSASTVDDPTQFQNMKQRKQVLLEGIKKFNVKPKKGIQYLVESGCIPTKSPKDIALFLLHTDGLNKTIIGEYLGEGDEENIAIMHAFVDEMDFSQMLFVPALRTFLQSFRLPGESQKIDRFMLKFAGRYVQGNPTSFSSADTAYVLAYSVIMLNTDQHNSQVKKRMTKSDFLKNNRGIDEGKDIPASVLESIFDEIQRNEIVMKDEQHAKMNSTSAIGNSPVGHKKENTESMATKTEALLNNIMKFHKRSATATSLSETMPDGTAGSHFIHASHYEHVKPMFSIIWMAVLASISTPLQDTEDNDMITTALEGFKCVSKIVCMFDMSAERKSVLSTLAKCTTVPSIYDLKLKNVDAIVCLLEIALSSGNSIEDNWTDVVSAIYQLEKVQQFTSELAKQRNAANESKPKPSSPKKDIRLLNEDAIARALSQSMTLTVDKVFASSAKLNGNAITEFVKAMCIFSTEEISETSMGSSEHPKMYCLQRLVEMSYYNMNRIRVEWSGLWSILGDHFNQVGCHTNTQVSFFALDKLRQLSMKFLDLEELQNFKFQKDFLKPFEVILVNNRNTSIKDMCLVCLQQMIQAKAKSLKSGWKAMFGAFTHAANEPQEQILNGSFDIVKSIFKNYFENIVYNLAFPDFVLCIVQFCQNKQNSKTSLQAVELLYQSFSKIAEISKNSPSIKSLQSTAIATEKIFAEMVHGSSAALLIINNLEKTFHSQANNITSSVTNSFPDLSGSTIDDLNFKFWFPIFHSLYVIIMTCELEVRTRALNHLFEALKLYGSVFPKDSWEMVVNGVIFPVFDDLKSSTPESGKKSMRTLGSKEELSLWVNSTLILVLKQFMELLGQYLEELIFCVDGVFDLLIVCMTQENETLARIGSTCLQQFVTTNAQKIDDIIWGKITAMFVYLFKVTTPDALFFDYREEFPQEPAGVVVPPESEEQTEVPGSVSVSKVKNEHELHPKSPLPTVTGKTKPMKSEFPGIISKCVLHLLVIQTLQELLAPSVSGSIYKSMSSLHLFTLIDCLERSYFFAKTFNEDMELRMALYRMGFMKTLPNLLKQETSSVSAYITILIKMYSDNNAERKELRSEMEGRLIPLSLNILRVFNLLDPEAKKRNVAAWRPVVVTILNALLEFDEGQFRRHMPVFYGEVLNLFLQEVSTDMRLVMHSLLVRTGRAFNITPQDGDSPSREIQFSQ